MRNFIFPMQLEKSNSTDATNKINWNMAFSFPKQLQKKIHLCHLSELYLTNDNKTGLETILHICKAEQLSTMGWEEPR